MKERCFESEFLHYANWIAPQLDIYEQTIYLFMMVEAIKNESNSFPVGLKSARLRMGFGIGDTTKPMSDTTVREKFGKLVAKGLLENLGSGRSGTSVRFIWPTSANGYEIPEINTKQPSIEDIDYFSDLAGRKSIVERENGQCFYCRRALTAENLVMEHIVSRPDGDNSYRNIVASCRDCNNRKGNSEATDFVRSLYRRGVLNQGEFEECLNSLKDNLAGKRIPTLSSF